MIARLKRPRLRTINNGLTVFVALLALYLIVSPFLPEVQWWARHDSPVQKVLYQPAPLPAPTVQSAQILDDTLVIPRLDMQEAIYGGGQGNLMRGVWHVSRTSTPDKGGNTVLIGHRFTYKTPRGVFYFLDKVQVGDSITVFWQHQVYEYRVAEIKIVPNTELSVQANTKDPILTLYTCTPVWNPINRLVVIAKPVEKTS